MKTGAWLGRMLICGLLLCSACATRAPVSVYQLLGQQAGLEALVDETLRVFAADPRVRPSFAQTDIPHFRRRFIEHLCMLSGGPCEYGGEDLRTAHAHLRIDEALFNAVVEDLQLAMRRRGLPETTQNRLLALLAPLRGEILSRGEPLPSLLIEH